MCIKEILKVGRQKSYLDSKISVSMGNMVSSITSMKQTHIFFLISKVFSLKAKRQRKEYTRNIPRYKEAKHQRTNKPHP